MQTDVSQDLIYYENARDVAVLAARIAGKKIKEVAGHISPDMVRDKGVHDLVTDTDEEAQKLIVDTILEAYPDHQILAEENPDSSNNGSQDAEYLWIIDPIDGTTNFTRGIPPYAVSIALSHNGCLVIGVVLDVAHGDIYTAIKGRGLQVNEMKCVVSETSVLAGALITTGFPYRAFDHVDQYLSVLKRFMELALGVRRPGSAAVDLAWVACGRFDGFFETGLKPWDVAAGIVLVREGGGRISDYRGDDEPAFDHQVVASNGHIHAEMLDLLTPMLEIYD
ncbi:MAG: inositol monophosphatase family protein [Rhodothermia bacterium]|nr:MAG: inositol monophosphatase family protein [Rhodothermia bacterium]